MASTRYIVAYLFTLNFVIGLLASLYILANIPSGILGLIAIPTSIFYAYSILLGICFLAVVYWVAEDEDWSSSLSHQIYALERRLEKTEQALSKMK